MEKLVHIISSIDTDTQKTVYIALTNNGRLFRSYNLKKWKLLNLPNFNTVVVEE